MRAEAVDFAARFFAAGGVRLPLRRLRASSSVRSITSAPPSGASSSGCTTVSVSPALTFFSTIFITACLNSSLNSSGFHGPDMSPTSCSAIFISAADSFAPLMPAAGRSSPSASLISSPQRSRLSTSTLPKGISSARCCLVAITTLARPTLPVFTSTSRSSA
ncbi:hypothetical protein D3C87_1462610 [compost metagenome]